jgi:hypothetical protein
MEDGIHARKLSGVFGESLPILDTGGSLPSTI